MFFHQFKHHPQRSLFRISQLLQDRGQAALIHNSLFSQFEMILLDPKIEPPYSLYHIIYLLITLRHK